MTQLSLLAKTPPQDFQGDTYHPKFDRERLTGLLERVKALMLDGQWRTLGEISRATGGSEASVSARLRDLRKARFGAFVVLRRRRGAPYNGLHEYRVLRP